MNHKVIFFLAFLIFSSFNTYGIESRRYLVTAATSGLGESICETLAAEKHALILAGRDSKKLKNLKKKLEQNYRGNYLIVLFDYSDPVSIQKLGTELNKDNIHGIVLIPPRVKINTTEIPSSEEWIEMFKMGFTAPMEIVKQTLPALQPSSSIVIISGNSSVQYLPNYKNVNVLRKMWTAQMKNLTYQLGDSEIRTNVISPGLVLTDYHNNRIQDRALKNDRTIEAQIKEETKDIPLQRYGQPKEIAETVSFLLSQKSSHITGVNLVIDGGINKSY